MSNLKKTAYWKEREGEFREVWLKKKNSLKEQGILHIMPSFVDVQNSLKEQGILHIMPSFVDVHGRPKAKAVPIDNFEEMMKGSELHTLSANEGLGQEVQDDECSVRPDLDAITPIPWIEGMAWAPGSLYFHGKPWPLCSRNVLKRQIEGAAAKGFV